MRASERIAMLEDEVNELRVDVAELRGRIAAIENAPQFVVIRETPGFGGTYPSIRPQIVTKASLPDIGSPEVVTKQRHVPTDRRRR